MMLIKLFLFFLVSSALLCKKGIFVTQIKI